MTNPNREAIKALQNFGDGAMMAAASEYKSGFLKTDVINRAIAALDKMEPKRPNGIKCDHIITGYCDVCGNYVSGTDNYCSECGHALKWGKEGE
ncbi:MAG: hypothetical protein LUH55_00760 [Bacteroides thetaiotaomicron]|nr:hypothetical protein [Bacteroides thetaiotaomicron]